MSIFEEANAAAVLIGGDRAEWTSATVTVNEPPPAAEGVGVVVETGLVAHVGAALREVPGARTVYVSIASYDPGAEYTIDVDVENVTIAPSAHSDVQSALQAIEAAINADPGMSAIVTATRLDADGQPAAVTGQPATRIRIRSTPAFGAGSWPFSATADLGALATEGDAESASVSVWARPAATGAPWMRVAGPIAVGTAGWLARIPVGSYREIAVRLSAIVGDGADAPMTYTPRRFVGRATRATL